MRSNRKHTTADLIYYIHLYEDGYSYRELSEKFGLLLSEATFYRYYLKFMEHGMGGLESSKKTPIVNLLKKTSFKNIFKLIAP